MFVHRKVFENQQLLGVYATLLSTGPSWLFTFFAIWAALLPDILVGMWEAYSAGDGVLVNKVGRKACFCLTSSINKVSFQHRTPGQILKKKLNRTVSYLSQTRFGKLKIIRKKSTHSESNNQPGPSYEARHEND